MAEAKTIHEFTDEEVLAEVRRRGLFGTVTRAEVEQMVSAGMEHAVSAVLDRFAGWQRDVEIYGKLQQHYRIGGAVSSQDAQKMVAVGARQA